MVSQYSYSQQTVGPEAPGIICQVLSPHKNVASCEDKSPSQVRLGVKSSIEGAAFGVKTSQQ